jgi:hypothetical protein
VAYPYMERVIIGNSHVSAWKLCNRRGNYELIQIKNDNSTRKRFN